MRKGDSIDGLARIIAHGLGHAIDFTFNDAADRDRWATSRGVDASTPWCPESGVAYFATPARTISPSALRAGRSGPRPCLKWEGPA